MSQGRPSRRSKYCSSAKQMLFAACVQTCCGFGAESEALGFDGQRAMNGRWRRIVPCHMIWFVSKEKF